LRVLNVAELPRPLPSGAWDLPASPECGMARGGNGAVSSFVGFVSARFGAAGDK
jgi:hypothetical protein